MSSTPFNNKILVNEDYAKTLLPLIKKSTRTISIMMFDWKWYKNDFTCDISLINQALICAARNGVKVLILTNSTDIQEHFLPVGITVRPFKVHGIFHPKLFIFDGRSFVIGSHNMTSGAMTRNYEVSYYSDDVLSSIAFDALFKNLWQS